MKQILLHNSDLTVYYPGVPSIQALRLCGASHTEEEEEGNKTQIRQERCEPPVCCLLCAS